MKRTLIFGNGTPFPGFLREIRTDDYIIGVDRAAFWLLRQGIIPDLAIGDFDSVSQKELDVIARRAKRVKRYVPEKDQTDMELAFAHARGEILVFGWSGTRMDHTIAALLLRENAVFIDATNRIRTIPKGRTILSAGGYRYVSVIPITATILVTMKNFKYPLSRAKIRRGSSRTISNEFLRQPGIIDLHAGMALLIESND